MNKTFINDKPKLVVPDHVLKGLKKKINEKKKELQKVPQPAGWRLTIFPLKLESKTSGGLHLTDDTIEQAQVSTNICKVLKVGDLAFKDESKFPTGPWCKEGDWIIITKYAGSRIKIDGGELRIINDDEVLAVVDDPRDILPPNLI